ncbi:MAG: hypothetical protein ACI4MB_05880 [Candidatus Coproplasma sp.]
MPNPMMTDSYLKLFGAKNAKAAWKEVKKDVAGLKSKHDEYFSKYDVERDEWIDKPRWVAELEAEEAREAALEEAQRANVSFESDGSSAMQNFGHSVSSESSNSSHNLDNENTKITAETVFHSTYLNFCEDALKEAWKRNIEFRCKGMRLNEDMTHVTQEFKEYMSGINALLAQKGVGNIPSADIIDSEVDQWQQDFLEQYQYNKIDVAKFNLYGKNPQTGKEPSVKQAVSNARNAVDNICRSTGGNKFKKCVDAVVQLRAVESMHAERSGLWKFFHPIDNYREKSAIRDMRAAIEQRFTQDMIDAIGNQELKVGWLEAERAGTNILPSQLNELRVNPLETNAEALDRANAERERTELENRELENEANRISEEANRINRAFEDDLDSEVNELDGNEIQAQQNGLENDFVDDLDRESLSVFEANDSAVESEKSQPHQEKSAPQLNKSLNVGK